VNPPPPPPTIATPILETELGTVQFCVLVAVSARLYVNETESEFDALDESELPIALVAITE
jgi:hypothetical protein